MTLIAQCTHLRSKNVWRQLNHKNQIKLCNSCKLNNTFIYVYIILMNFWISTMIHKHEKCNVFLDQISKFVVFSDILWWFLLQFLVWLLYSGLNCIKQKINSNMFLIQFQFAQLLSGSQRSNFFLQKIPFNIWRPRYDCLLQIIHL